MHIWIHVWEARDVLTKGKEYFNWKYQSYCIDWNTNDFFFIWLGGFADRETLYPGGDWALEELQESSCFCIRTGASGGAFKERWGYIVAGWQVHHDSFWFPLVDSYSIKQHWGLSTQGNWSELACSAVATLVIFPVLRSPSSDHQWGSTPLPNSTRYIGDVGGSGIIRSRETGTWIIGRLWHLRIIKWPDSDHLHPYGCWVKFLFSDTPVQPHFV